jgi:hypothetical protein
MSAKNPLIRLDQLIRNDYNLRLYVREGVYHVRLYADGLFKHHSMHDDSTKARQVFRDLAIEYDMVALDVY